MDSKKDSKQKPIDLAEEEALFGSQAPFASASTHPSISTSVLAQPEEPFLQPHQPTDAPPEYSEAVARGPIFPAYKGNLPSAQDHPPSSRSNHPQGHARSPTLPSAPQEVPSSFPQPQPQQQQQHEQSPAAPSSSTLHRSLTPPSPSSQHQQQPEDQRPLLGHHRASSRPSYGAAAPFADAHSTTPRSPQQRGLREDNPLEGGNVHGIEGQMRALKGQWNRAIKRRAKMCSIFVWICILIVVLWMIWLEMFGGRRGSGGGGGGGGGTDVCNLEKTRYTSYQEQVADIGDGFDLDVVLPQGIFGNVLVREADDWADPSIYFRVAFRTSTGELLDRTTYAAFEDRPNHWEFGPVMDYESPQERDRLLEGGKNCVRADVEIVFPLKMKKVKGLHIHVEEPGNVVVDVPFVTSIFEKVDIVTRRGDIHFMAVNVMDRVQVRVEDRGSVSGAVKTMGVVDVQVGKGGGGIALDLDAQTGMLGNDDRRLNVTMAVEGEGSVALNLVRHFQGHFSTVSESGEASFRKDEGLKQIVHHSKQREGLDVGWVSNSGREPSSMLPRVDLRTVKGDVSGTIAGKQRRDHD